MRWFDELRLGRESLKCTTTNYIIIICIIYKYDAHVDRNDSNGPTEGTDSHRESRGVRTRDPQSYRFVWDLRVYKYVMYNRC